MQQRLSEQFFSAFEQAVSEPRLRRYRRHHTNNLDAMAAYLWNIALSESLYPCLQCLEVALRNAVNEQLIKLTRRDDWYDDRTIILPAQTKQVRRAKISLQHIRPPLEHSRVIAELTFGFWTALFTAPYQRIAFAIIPGVFTNASARERNRNHVSARLQAARKLRNRIFHHEPIWHNLDIETQYDQVMEMLNWINPSKAEALSILCRFHSVYQNGWGNIVMKLIS